MPTSRRAVDFLRTCSWAVYLGCSWTWCIGMFLPVILVSEFGNIAWFVFAIPNVIGAAAMGWTLVRPGSSEKIVEEHRAACVSFTAITFAFHVFFLYWLTRMGMMPARFAIVALTTGTLLGFVGRYLNGLDLIVGWIVWAVSLVVFGKGMMHPVFGIADPQPETAVHALSSMIGLAPICLFGFLLCPYLDVTFHRARRMTPPAAGKFAFGFGFGFVFLSMIVLTLLYAGDFAKDTSIADRFGSFGGQLLITWVAFHIATQTGYTFAVHIRALPRARVYDLIIWTVAGLLAALAIFAIRQELWFTVKQLSLAMLSGRLMYHLFMSFYGLVFPSYVWMFIVPLRGKRPSQTKGTLGVWIVSILIAAPFFWLGFVNEWMLWLIPGVSVLLAARFVVPWVNVQLPTLNVQRSN